MSIVVTGADATRRAAISDALARAGVPNGTGHQGTGVRIDDTDAGVDLTVGDITVSFSPEIELDDLASVARLGVALASVDSIVAKLEDDEPAGVVAAIVAHDARNALIPMLLAADDLLEHPDETVVQQARILADGCRSVTPILRRIAMLQPSEPRLIDVNTLVQGILSTLAALAGDRAQLSTRLESPLPAVWMDPSALRRTLVNLVSNARDASRRGGRIVVATSTRKLGDGSRWVVLEVEDYGIGMDEVTRARACEPFFTTKADVGGTGLGLTSVARAARKAGGNVELDSAPGRGTRVCVWLPVPRGG